MLIGFGLALVVAFVVAHALGRRPWPEGQDFLLVRTNVTRLAEAKPGDLVKVKGVIQPLTEFLAAPLTGQPCIGYEISVEGFEETLDRRPLLGPPGEVRTFLKRVHEVTSFRLLDGACEAIIDGPFFARFLNDDADQVESHRVPTSRAVRKAAIRAGAPADLLDDRARYREAHIVPGSVVYVFGRVDVRPDAGGVRESLRGPPMLRAIRGTLEEPVAVRTADIGAIGGQV